jgi:hypothetical protein
VILLAGLAKAGNAPVAVTPPFADRLFPYVTYGEVWQGTPARRSDVALPNVAIVYGAGEDRAVIAEAGRIAFYLGHWVEDAGFSVEAVTAKKLPPLMVSDAVDLPASNLIVAGRNNRYVKKYGIAFGDPTVASRDDGARKLLFAAGASAADDIRAIRYLADVRLNFKAGAYATFFNFVRLRGYLEEENWAAATDAVEHPLGLSACGKNMALMAPMVAQAPDRIKQVIRRRNELLYTALPAAAGKRDGPAAEAAWHEAMQTCYACHQGAGGFPVMRKFKPLESIHAKHQRIAERFDFEESCVTCHDGDTAVRGYAAKPKGTGG